MNYTFFLHWGLTWLAVGNAAWLLRSGRRHLDDGRSVQVAIDVAMLVSVPFITYAIWEAIR